MWRLRIIIAVYLQIVITQLESLLVPANLVTGPSTDYVILGGNIPVQYSLINPLPGMYLGLYKQGSNDEIAREVVQQIKTGIVQFPCYTILYPGVYDVKLFSSSGEVLPLGKASQITAVWPQFSLTLPNKHIAQEATQLQLISVYLNQKITCRTQGRETSFYLEVQYSEEESFTDIQVVHLEEDIQLKTLNNDARDLPCQLFDRAGFYRVVLRQRESESYVSTSNTMTVTWGDYYELSSVQTKVFPCADQLVITFTRPDCITMADNIHMYATRLDKTGQQELSYMYEAKAMINKTSVSFSCDDIRRYHWANSPTAYCFRYQSVASNQAVVDHSLFCLPINSSIGLPVDGQWSQWYKWSECSGNCEYGRQSRVRYCNSPSPANGGKFCDGGVSVDWRVCESSCKTAPLLRTGPVTSRPRHRIPKCWCGCPLSDSSGIIIPGRRCKGDANYFVHMVWHITTEKGSQIQLNVSEFKWNHGSQILKVRDGLTYSSLLLMDLRGNEDHDEQHVISSSNYLHVEFMSGEEVPYDFDLFIISYSTYYAGESYLLQGQATTNQSENQKWRLPAIIGGSVTSAVLIFTFLAAYAYRRIRVAQVIKRAQAQNTSPNHVVMQVQSGEYTNFGDITPSVQTVRSGRGGEKTHTSTARHSRRDQRAKIHRTNHRNKLQGIREDEGPGITLPDPYHVKPEDFLHASDLLHLSTPIAGSQHPLNLNIPPEKGGAKRKAKKHKRRRLRSKQGPYEDPQEVDNLINSLPVAPTGKRYASVPPVDPDSSDSFPLLAIPEYRALINQLSSTGSHNQSTLIDTSAEVHPVPHTTPVENTSHELSPLVSPDAINGQRSPCLDDGYNSLANTGSTQSNLSSRDREPPTTQRLNQIKERPGSSDRSSSIDNRTPQRPSSHNCSIASPQQGKQSSCRGSTPYAANELQLSHITCPLNKPDGESDEECSLPQRDPYFVNHSCPTSHSTTLEPPLNFADSKAMLSLSSKPREPPGLLHVRKADDTIMSNSNTTSDSYEYDDYLPPPVTSSHSSTPSDPSWCQPPIAEENLTDVHAL
ncbi:uncharacterized protein [Watersipora subatra]|uniref:uncharacterized protein isoform X2 n=1 Tax=Watersipora subatra TaxID=2589382 RepID=UPI00355C7C55